MQDLDLFTTLHYANDPTNASGRGCPPGHPNHYPVLTHHSGDLTQGFLIVAKLGHALDRLDYELALTFSQVVDVFFLRFCTK